VESLQHKVQRLHATPDDEAVHMAVVQAFEFQLESPNTN
jgi:hypothetical protein